MPKNPHADFSPVLDGYSGIGAFRFWCQTALPLTYDDSLSYYELLNKVVNYLNHTIEDLTTVENNTSALAEAYNQLQKYVNDYFDDLDVEAELRNVLDAMAEDGTLNALLEPIVENQLPGVVEEKIDGVVAEQIDGAVAGQIDESVADQLPALVDAGIPGEVSEWLEENVDPVGSAIMVDSTLSISGAAADAKVTGDKLSELKTQINSIDNDFYFRYNEFKTEDKLVSGTIIGEAYTTTPSGAWKSTEIDVEEGYSYKTIFSTPSDSYYRSYIIFCDDNNIIKGYYAKTYDTVQTQNVNVICPPDATRMIVNAFVSSGVYTLQIYRSMKKTIEYITNTIKDIQNELFYDVNEYAVNSQLIMGTTVGEAYTTISSAAWKSTEIDVEEGYSYRASFSTPSDGYYRSYIIFCDDNNIIKGYYAKAYSAGQTQNVNVICPPDATRMIVNAFVSSGVYTLQLYYSLKEKIAEVENDLTEEITNIEIYTKYGPSNGEISRGEIILPSVIYVASGRQCNLYWSSIANIVDGDKSVYFETKCDIGKNTERGFVIDADITSVGAHTIKIVCKDTYSRNILSTYNGTILVVAPQNISEQKNILMVGDSRTWQRSNGTQGTDTNSDAGKTITAETKSLLSSVFTDIFNFIGTEISPFDSSIKNLAISGWTITDAMNTIQNAGGIVDYVENSCGLGPGGSLDIVTIMFGVNDLANWRANNLNQYNVSIAKISGFINKLRTFVGTIHTSYPSAKIIVVIEPTTCANQDGFGYFGVNTEKDAHIELEQALKVLRKTLIDEIENGNYSNVFLSSAGVWCDRLYNFPYINEKPSIRTSIKIVPRYVNCVHPHDDGYKQIADGIYSTIIGLYQ